MNVLLISILLYLTFQFVGDSGNPLFLTPLIDAGHYKEAKSRARVPPSLGGVVSYSGFLTVNSTTKSHLFFWFFPKAGEDPNPSPLLLWLQGGPGCSSLFGLFDEHGPFHVTKNGLQSREYAWTDHYHMLYIDQPIGTGFSFTEDDNNGYVNDQEGVREHLYEALIQFYEVFPEMKHEDFYIAGESYAGKYGPALGHKIHTANRQSSAFEIPLKGMMIGNGFSDPMNILPRSEYFYDLDIIDENDRVKLEMSENMTMSLIQSGKYSEASDSYRAGVSSVMILNLINPYDYRGEYTEALSQVMGDPYASFLTQNHIRRRIHVGRNEYETCSQKVMTRFKSDYMQTVRPWIEELLENYPILFYNGQFDLACPHKNLEKFLNTLHWSGANEYHSAERRLWIVDGSVGGYYKVGSNLFDVWVRGAGHAVPVGQPKNALYLIKSFVENRSCAKNSTYSVFCQKFILKDNV